MLLEPQIIRPVGSLANEAVAIVAVLMTVLTPDDLIESSVSKVQNNSFPALCGLAGLQHVQVCVSQTQPFKYSTSLSLLPLCTLLFHNCTGICVVVRAFHSPSDTTCIPHVRCWPALLNTYHMEK